MVIGRIMASQIIAMSGNLARRVCLRLLDREEPWRIDGLKTCETPVNRRWTCDAARPSAELKLSPHYGATRGSLIGWSPTQKGASLTTRQRHGETNELDPAIEPPRSQRPQRETKDSRQSEYFIRQGEGYEKHLFLNYLLCALCALCGKTNQVF